MPSDMAFWIIGFGLTGAGLLVGMKRTRNKRVIQLELSKKEFSLISGNGVIKLPYEAIQNLHINSEPEGPTRSMFLKTKGVPFVILKGFENMEGLADQLEKGLADPSRVKKNERKITPARKFGGFLFGSGLLIAFLGLTVGFIYLVAKMGFGKLMGPLCFVFLGISKFASNRYNRNARIQAILFILGGFAFGAIELFLH